MVVVATATQETVLVCILCMIDRTLKSGFTNIVLVHHNSQPGGQDAPTENPEDRQTDRQTDAAYAARRIHRRRH